MAVPTVASVTPSTGSYLGGTTVLIVGTGFTGTTSVTFDGVAADFELSSATLLAATAPPHLSGTAQVVVTNADGPSTDAVLFTYTVPSSAPITYVGTLATDLDQVRFAIGDTVSGSGPRPDGANFSDAELTGLIAAEGTWQRAVAGAFETLAALWATHQSFTVGDVQVGQTNIGISYRDQAKDWRKRYGVSAPATSGSSAVARADGYSSTLDSVTV